LDNLTHTLFGATVGRALFSRAGRGTTAALVIASNVPDADIVTAAGGSLAYLAWHRGPTHGPLGVVGLSVLTAGVVWVWQRYLDGARRMEHASYLGLLLASAVGLLGHVLMDFPTSYGTRLLSPFDWHWYAADLMPIVDIYLLAVLAAGFVAGRRRPASRQRLAVAALAFMALNYSVRAATHQAALARARTVLAPILPTPCAGFPRGLVASRRRQRISRARRHAVPGGAGRRAQLLLALPLAGHRAAF
jgi:inner membrane protein